MIMDAEVIDRYRHANSSRGITGIYEEALKDNTKLENIRKLIKEYRSDKVKDRNMPSIQSAFLVIAQELEEAIGK